MTTQLEAWLDQEDRDVAMKVRQHGCHITYVLGCGCSRPACLSRPSFFYSTGFFGLGHPELLVFSVGPETAQGLINQLFAEVRGGRDLVPGELLTFPAWRHRVVVEQVPNPQEIAFTAMRHYGKAPFDPLPLLQLTYDDLGGRFPWDPGYANEPWIQPRPGTFHA